MRKLKMVVLLSLATLGLSGCTVKYKAVGSFDDYNEVFVGDVDHNLLAGSAYIVAETKNSKIKCEGQSYVTYIPPLSFGCAGQRGKAPLRCTDGRRLTIDWVAKSRPAPRPRSVITAPTRPPPSAAGRRPSSARIQYADRDDGNAGCAPDLTPRTAANPPDRETSLLQGAKTGA